MEAYSALVAVACLALWFSHRLWCTFRVRLSLRAEIDAAKLRELGLDDY